MSRILRSTNPVLGTLLPVFNKRIRRCIVAILCTLAAMLPWTLPAQARDTANVMPQVSGQELAAIQARRKELLQIMMADPADLDAAFEFATLSSRAGDLEAAISTFQRMLILVPGVPRLQLELGVLYFRLGSYEMAKEYLEQALAAPNIPQAVQANVAPFLAAIKEKTAVNQFHGGIMIGARYQTNANGGPQDEIINLNGLDFILDDTALADSDANAFVSGNIRYSRKLSSQGDRFDVGLNLWCALCRAR